MIQNCYLSSEKVLFQKVDDSVIEIVFERKHKFPKIN